MTRLRRVLAAACICAATFVVWITWFIDRTGAADTWHDANVSPTGATAIVMLGARVEPDGSASPTLRARAESAASLFLLSNTSAQMLVFSGGVGTHGASEASVARDIAVKLGVPPERCVLEENSHSTAENARFTMRLLRERHGPGRIGVIVVSDPYHLARAKLLFEREGAAVGTSPVFDAPRHRDPLQRLLWTLREVPAFMREVWRDLRIATEHEHCEC